MAHYQHKFNQGIILVAPWATLRALKIPVSLENTERLLSRVPKSLVKRWGTGLRTPCLQQTLERLVFRDMTSLIEHEEVSDPPSIHRSLEDVSFRSHFFFNLHIIWIELSCYQIHLNPSRSCQIVQTCKCNTFNQKKNKTKTNYLTWCATFSFPGESNLRDAQAPVWVAPTVMKAAACGSQGARLPESHYPLKEIRKLLGTKANTQRFRRTRWQTPRRPQHKDIPLLTLTSSFWATNSEGK